MTEIYSPSLRPSPPLDIHSQSSQNDRISIPRRSIVPTDYHVLSPLDALAAQGRLLNKRLTQTGEKNHRRRRRRHRHPFSFSSGDFSTVLTNRYFRSLE